MSEPNRADQVLFISHSAVDRPYALAIKRAIVELLGSESMIDVRYSSSAETGPQGGDRWRQWIDSQVVECRTALILVTPESLSKPWLLWEAGACRGAALERRRAGDDGPGRLIVSIAYGLSETECPDPLRGDQIVVGTDPERVEQLFYQLLNHHELPDDTKFRAFKRIESVVEKNVAAAREALLSSPSLVTEANIREWLDRLRGLDTRGSELAGFERWMNLAFGREGETADVPIDVRLHRRLGELYLGRREFGRAVRQLELARRAAPRDIYVLRPLGQAHMSRFLEKHASTDEAGAMTDRIRAVLDAIHQLDSDAFTSNPDAAALYGKYQRRALGDPAAAIRTFEVALGQNPDSYYLADLLGQAHLQAGNLDAARATYEIAIEVLDRLAAKGETNVWTYATCATACLVLGDFDRVRSSLAAIAREDDLNVEILDTIRRGIHEVGERLGADPAVVADLVGPLDTNSMASAT